LNRTVCGRGGGFARVTAKNLKETKTVVRGERSGQMPGSKKEKMPLKGLHFTEGGHGNTGKGGDQAGSDKMVGSSRNGVGEGGGEADAPA